MGEVATSPLQFGTGVEEPGVDEIADRDASFAAQQPCELREIGL